MAKNGIVMSMLVGAMALGGCKSTPPKEAPADATAQPEAARKAEYFPLVPKVEWEELNCLQKTTAAIAIVPGCVFSALANGYIWASEGTSLELRH